MSAAEAPQRHDERGDTLVEVLVAILIMGVTSVALLGAFLVSIAGSSEHRSYATVDTLLRSFAGAAVYQVQLQPSAQFHQCAGPTYYQIVEPYPANASVGSTIQVFGSGFKPGKFVQISIGTQSVTAFITAGRTVAATGAVAATLTLPSAGIVPGANSLTMTDGTYTGTGSINISSTPTVASSVTHYSVLVTSVQYWNGSGFVSSCTVNGNSPQLLTISATSAGSTVDSVTTVVSNPSSITPVPPVFASANTTTFSVGTLRSFTVQASGTPTPNFTESGALPAGVTFVDDNDGTATLAGTPQAGTSGTYHLTFIASNGIIPDASQSFTLVVGGPPNITSASSYTAKTSTAFSFSVTTSGTPTASISKSGSLPGGVTFVDNGNGTATLSGTPAAGTGGVYPITITATNGNNPNATQAFTLTVQQSPTITSANNALFAVGVTSSFTVMTSGYPTAGTITESGALPSGVTLTNNGDGTASLHGKPAAGTSGTYAITISASNGVNPAASQSFTVTVGTAPIFTSANSSSAQAKKAYSFTVTTSGNPNATITYVITSGSAAWLTITPNANGTASLSGTPPNKSSGTVVITFTASNGIAPNATQVFTLTWS